MLIVLMQTLAAKNVAFRKRQTSLQSFLGGSIRLTLEHPEVQHHKSNLENQEPESLVREFDNYTR